MGCGASVSRANDFNVSQHNYSNYLENQRRAALVSANSKLNEILIKDTGFSKFELIISENESVVFVATSRKKQKNNLTPEAEENEVQENETSLDTISIVQVIQDDFDGKFRRVIGGLHVDKVDAKTTVKFRSAGEYVFKLENHPSPAPCKIKVIQEIPLTYAVTDEGFIPRIIRIDEGTTVKWAWQKLSYPHSIYEAEYCDAHSGLYRTTKELVMPSLTNTYKKKFEEPGVFYFQTESRNTEQKHVCIVEVSKSFREHRVEILDNKFSPARITIDEGDKVWFSWYKEKCQKKHCVYQIHPPTPDHPPDRAYIGVKNGFKWIGPTRAGLLCHTFDRCGVYYFGDICGNECASYIGIIAVKKKSDHINVNYIEETKRFENEILTVESGDLIWWRWNKPSLITINLIDASLLYDKTIDKNKCKNFNSCQQLDADGLAKSGIFSYKIKKAGCYYFKVFNGNEDFVFTVVATPIQKDHKIEITDHEAKPNILNIHPEDRVWFVWDETKKPHNIRQVNHENKVITDGFLSGSLMESPGTFVESFDDLGIFYYRSDNYKGIMGAIVVVPEPTIQVVHVNDKGLEPDPIVVHINDLVIWEFEKYQSNDLVLVKNETDLYKYVDTSDQILPRRYLSYSFRESGVYHFVSPSFDLTVNPNYIEASRGLDKTIISTVVVDKIEEYTTVLVDSNGFHPDLINVELGKSVLFDWRDTNESHNIIHYTLPNEKTLIRPVEGPRAFNSGKAVVNNSFLHTFEEEGHFCVVSDGAPKTYCVIQVLKSAAKAETPKLVNQDPLVLFKYHKIFLDCHTEDAVIHYTTDGSLPSKLSPQYSKEGGIVMNEEGINIIRALAFSEKYLTSDVFTSHRFYVIADAERQSPDYLKPGAEEANEIWWKCIPRIVTNSLGVGCIEIAWDKTPEECYNFISHYQIFLNKVSYRKVIPSNVNKVLVKGLSGGRNYNVAVMVFPKEKSLLPQQSNVVTVKCSKTTNLGGPVISLKANPNRDQITVSWLSIDLSSNPISHYELLINGEKREIINPAPGKHKVTIEGCKVETKYSVLLVAIPKSGGVPLISNELEIMLPLDLEEITLPDPALRNLDKDFYDEYIEITDLESRNIVTPGPARSEPSDSNKEILKSPKPKHTPYLSYDNYLIANKDNLLKLQDEPNLNLNLDLKLSLDMSDKDETFGESKSLSREKSLSIKTRSSEHYQKDILDTRSSSKIKEPLNYIENESKDKIETEERDLEIKVESNIDIKEDVEQVSIPGTIDEETLPIPKVTVSHLRSCTITVEWYMTELPPPYLKLTHYVITLVGNEFSNSITSDASYECLIEKDNKKVPAVQHCWIKKYNATAENKFIIEGIIDTAIYQITVNAVYRLVDSNSTTEYKKSSKTIFYTPLGPPNPPRLRVNMTDIQSASLEWIAPHYPRPEFIAGYRLVVNSELNQAFEKTANEFMFTDMQPGKKYNIEIITLTNSIVGQSKPSNAITLICPRKPNPPLISQLPTVRPNSVVIGWKPCDPKSNNKFDEILFYKIYLNEKYHGEIHSTNINAYSYMICDLVPGKTYDVTVQSFCGERFTHPVEGPLVSCIIASDPSNVLSITPTAPPDPVRLKLATISPEGIDVTWLYPQQYGDAVVSGFHLVRNGRLYGNIIPHDAVSYKITDLELGDVVDLQMISLTNHPVGKYTALHNHPNYTMDQPQREMILNGPTFNSAQAPKRISAIHPDYPACKIGPVLSIKYTNLVKPAVKVWTEKVTGYSAMVNYQTSRMNDHFVEAEYYLVSYWPGTVPSDNIKTIKTDKDFVELNNLKPTTIYTVQVESRRELKRVEDIDDPNEKHEYKYIIYSKSNLMQFQTASPPDPPTNLSVVSTTCHAIKICWDPPVDHGSELIAIRIDCYPLDVDKPLHIFKELTPDTKSCIIDNLSEKTVYRISVTAITEEYFINHKIKELKQLPKLILESMPWLPSAHIDASTSGTDPPTNIEWKLKHDRSLGITWKHAKVYGTNRLINQILCYQEIGINNSMAVQIPLPANAKGYKLQNLKIGSKYKIWIEAVVLIKVNIDSDTVVVPNPIDEDEVNFKDISQIRIDHYKELKDSRCTNVCSDVLILRVPAPCEPVIINLTGYSSETIDIYWSKPYLYSQHRDPDNQEKKIHLYRHLLGYRIEVNGIRQRSLTANENVCTLTKCKPLNTYNVVVVALTCLSTVVKNNNPILDEIDINDIDESYSKPLQIKLFPNDKDDMLNRISGKYEEIMDTNEPNSVGRIKLEWDIKNSSNVSQQNVNWFSAEESLAQHKNLDPSARSCYIPVTKHKCIYEINLEVLYEGSKAVFTTDRLFIEIPGSPDAPDLWLKEQKDNEVTIHWSEPRVYPNVPVAGYQIYLNDVKVGSKIDRELQKVTLPLKPNRNYKINVQAISSRKEFADSVYSNSLNVTTSMISSTQYSDYNNRIDMLVVKGSVIDSSDNRSNDPQVIALIKFYEDENAREFDAVDSLIPIRINKLTEDYIDIDWSKYVKTDTLINEFRIQWHCLNTNEHFEHRCSPNISTYRIKRLKAGYTYCLKISSIKNTNTVVNRSKNYILQMNASPDAPVLKLRACNFKYITLEWNRPLTYGEAPIVAYKLYVDGKVEAVLSADQTVFTLSKGDPCREYTFQIQAVTADESLMSPVSAPLKVTWPGIKLPTLRAIENDNDVVRITWDDPIMSGNAKISYYRVIAEDENTEKVVVQGPFESNIRECEFFGLTTGRHKIHLEITAYGSVEPLCTQPIYVDFGHKPEAPNLSVQVIGLDERKRLEKIASSLTNKRDRLLRIVTSKKANPNLPRAISTLRQLDEALNDCIKLIANYTGYLIVNLAWTSYQPNPAVRLLGYRVYVNGQQYGIDLHESIRTVRVKLSLEKAVHSIYITAFTDRAKMESQNSNVVELLSENFFPFTFYCYHDVHIKSKTWPERGCCAYQDTLPVERQNLGKTKEPVNIGILSDKPPAMKCQVIDLATKNNKNLVESKSKSGRPTVILFWTKWCLSSIRTLNYFVMYAKRNSHQSEYVACHCGEEDSDELLDLLRKGGYLDSTVKFVSDIQYAGKKENTEISSVEHFDIKGVPTIVVVNKFGMIVWKGRYCSYDFTYYECFMHHTFSEVLGTKCPVLNCEFCIGELSIEKELTDLRSEQKLLSNFVETFIKPTNEDAWTGVEIARKSVPRLPKINTRQVVNVIPKQLVSVRTNAGNRSGSERGLFHTNKQQILHSFSIKKKTQRSNSTDGFCYYHKGSKRN